MRLDVKYHTIVIGLGAMGSATLYQLTRHDPLSRYKFLGIDQYTPPHNFGSSHGESRMTRLANGEYPEYSATALRSHEIWQMLQTSRPGQNLYNPTGGLIIGSQAQDAVMHKLDTPFFQQTIAAAKTFGISHRLLSAVDLKKNYPQFNITDNELAYYENAMGFLRPEACIQLQLNLAKKNGADIHTQETVLKLEMTRDKCPVVITNKGEYQAEKIVLSVGPWLQKFLPENYKSLCKIYRQYLCWFQIEKRAVQQFMPENCPVFARIFPNGDVVYGFPIIDGNDLVKFGFDSPSIYQNDTTPEQLNREVTVEEINLFYQHYIAPYFTGVSDVCLKSVVCPYTSTANRRFIVDYLPETHERVILVSACSGHGFKHSAAIGEALAQNLITGSSTIDIFNLFAAA